VTRQRVQYANEKQRLLSSQNERRRARLQLLKAMNLRLDTEIELTDQLSYIPVDATLLQQAKANALEARWGLQGATGASGQRPAGNERGKDERLPSLTTFVTTARSAAALETPFRPRVWRLAAVPISTGDAGGKRAESESQFREERIRSADLKDQIDLDVRLALDALQSAEDEVKVAAEGLNWPRMSWPRRAVAWMRAWPSASR
jgi:outer membrane protein TolC